MPRICKCGTDMTWVGASNNDGRFWCPLCGRYSQSYVCDPTKWHVPTQMQELTSAVQTLSTHDIHMGEHMSYMVKDPKGDWISKQAVLKLIEQMTATK